MLRLFIAEEQGLLLNLYENYFTERPDFQLVAASPDVSADGVTRAAQAFRPDVMVLGTKVARGTQVEAVRRLHDDMPGLTTVMLASSYDLHAAQGILDHLQRVTTGFAFLLKDSVDYVEDLARIALVAASGHVIVAPGLVRDFVGALNEYANFFKPLSPRDIEVLDLMAKGDSDAAIASKLGLTAEEVEAQIEAIYDKTGARTMGVWDPRVHTITTYLKAKGVLPVRDFRVIAEELAPGAGRSAVGEHDVRVEPADQRQVDEGKGPQAPDGGPSNGPSNGHPHAPRAQQQGPSDASPQSPTWTWPVPGRPANGIGAPSGTWVQALPRVEQAPAAQEPSVARGLGQAMRRYGAGMVREFDRFVESARAGDVDVAARLLEWAAECDLRARFGQGRLEGSFSVTLEVQGVAFWLFSVWAIGAVEVQFQMLEAQRPFAEEGKRLELARRLEQVRGVSIPPDGLSGRPRVPVSALRQAEDLERFLETMDWVVSTIKDAWAPTS